MDGQPLLPALISLLLNWLPMFVLIGVWIYYMRRATGRSGMTQIQYLKELLKETRRHNEQLEQLLASTNDRLADIERRK